MESEKTEQYKAALKLAGALAQAANRVVNSKVSTIGRCVEELADALYEYNGYILEMTEKTYTKSN